MKGGKYTFFVANLYQRNFFYRVQLKYRLTTEDLSELEDHEEEALLHIKPADRQDTSFPHFWPHRWLDDEAIFAFRFYFSKVSEAFDNMFFKAGKRHTSKCYAFNNTTAKHARHNLVSEYVRLLVPSNPRAGLGRRYRVQRA